jgi:hypothetical protein
VEEEEEEHLLTLWSEAIWSILRNATDLRRTENLHLNRGTGIEVGTRRQFNVVDTFVSLSFRSFGKSLQDLLEILLAESDRIKWLIAEDIASRFKAVQNLPFNSDARIL